MSTILNLVASGIAALVMTGTPDNNANEAIATAEAVGWTNVREEKGCFPMANPCDPGETFYRVSGLNRQRQYAEASACCGYQGKNRACTLK